MAERVPRYTDGVPVDVVARVRQLCLALPDAYEEPAWRGTRWMVRKRTFAHVLGFHPDGASHCVMLSFRSDGDELEVLRRAGPPFVELGWGRDSIGLVIDDLTDWGEVHELITESFCVMAPKRLVSLVDRPSE